MNTTLLQIAGLLPRFTAGIPRPRTAASCFMAATLLFVVALALRFLILPPGAGLHFVTMYPALVVASLLCGRTGGLWVLTLGVATGYLIVTQPPELHDVDVAGLITYALSGAGIVLIMGGLMRAREQLQARLSQQARDAAGLAEDVAWYRQMERALRESEARFRDTLEHAPIGMAIVSLEGRFQQANRALCDITGHHREELETLTIGQITHPADLEARKALARNMLGGETNTGNMKMRFLRADRRVVWVHIHAFLLRNEEGKPLHFIAQVEDITLERHLEEERANHLLHISNLSRRLVAVQEDERRRLASFVDDMLSPNLAAVQLYLAGIAARATEPACRALDRQLADTRALVQDTAAQLTDLSTDLRPFVLDYAGLLPALDGYAHRFTTRTGIPVTVRGAESGTRLPSDVESLLFRIAQEALSNCARHAAPARVTIELDHDDEHARLLIADDGIGFAADGSVPTADSHGFITMRERAEFAGGRFCVDSAIGRGTRILVEI